MLSGVVLGGAAAGIALAIVFLLHGEPRAVFDPFVWIVAGVVGGVLGSVIAPLISWLLLRRVSLGRALLQTMLGAIAGGVIAAVLFPATILAPLWSAFLGYTAAALRLNLATRPMGPGSPTSPARLRR